MNKLKSLALALTVAAPMVLTGSASAAVGSLAFGSWVNNGDGTRNFRAVYQGPAAAQTLKQETVTLSSPTAVADCVNGGGVVYKPNARSAWYPLYSGYTVACPNVHTMVVTYDFGASSIPAGVIFKVSQPWQLVNGQTSAQVSVVDAVTTTAAPTQSTTVYQATVSAVSPL